MDFENVEILVKNLNDNTPTITVENIIYLEADVTNGDTIFTFEVRKIIL